MMTERAGLQAILPSSISGDETVRQAAAAVDAAIMATDEGIINVLLMSRIPVLPEAVVDALAWQFHVDTYDEEMDIDQKRQLVENAIRDHKYKGTPWAVKSVVKVILGYAEVEEWWQYDGSPYHFRVNGSAGPVVYGVQLEKLVYAINRAKNVRSWLDGIYFKRTIPVEKTVGIGMYNFKKITIGLPQIVAQSQSTQKTVGVGLYAFKKTVIEVGG